MKEKAYKLLSAQEGISNSEAKGLIDLIFILIPFKLHDIPYFIYLNGVIVA